MKEEIIIKIEIMMNIIMKIINTITKIIIKTINTVITIIIGIITKIKSNVIMQNVVMILGICDMESKNPIKSIQLFN